MTTNEAIPIFFAADDGYVPYLATAIHSLLTNASAEHHYKIIVLSQDISNENQKRLKSLATKNSDIEFVSMQDRIQGITDRASNYLRCDFFTLTIYYRLFIPIMFPEYDKAIYIDSDVVLAGDISELYNIDLGDNLIGACPDFSVQKINAFVEYIENVVGVKKAEYINSGVLLMNLKRLREVNLDTRFLELLNRYHFDTIAPDQDYLNAMCNGSILYIPECWDAMPRQDAPALEQPKLIHYNLFFKPWCYDNIQYEDYFWKYAASSGYLREILENKRAYSDEQKKADGECLEKMLRTASDLLNKEITFHTIFSSGKEKRLA